MRHYDETAGERSREEGDASESRRFVIEHDEPAPRGIVFWAAIGLLALVVLVVLARVA